MDNNLSIALEWYEYAENDFEVAQILSKQVKPKIEIICYHCQQCVEKYLKGFIASNGEKLQKTHSLVALCNTCVSFDKRFNEILEICANLTVYGSELRYPNKLEIDKNNMKKALDDANKVRILFKHLQTKGDNL